MQLAKLTGPGSGTQTVDKDAAVALIVAAFGGMTNIGGTFNAMITVDGQSWTFRQVSAGYEIIWPDTELLDVTDSQTAAKVLSALAERVYTADSFAAFLVINGETWVIAP